MTEPYQLSWGIKRSFLRYLESLPDCAIATNDGATRDGESGEFCFPFMAKTELDENSYRLEFSGDARIKAHGGMLLVIFMNPWLTFTESSVEFSVVDLMAWPDTSQREVLGVSPLGASTEPEASVATEFPLRLAESAVETFNNVYQAGEPLEPVKLH